MNTLFLSHFFGRTDTQEKSAILAAKVSLPNTNLGRQAVCVTILIQSFQYHLAYFVESGFQNRMCDSLYGAIKQVRNHSRYIQHAAAVAETSPSSATDQSGLSGFGGYRWYPTL